MEFIVDINCSHVLFDLRKLGHDPQLHIIHLPIARNPRHEPHRMFSLSSRDIARISQLIPTIHIYFGQVRLVIAVAGLKKPYHSRSHILVDLDLIRDGQRVQVGNRADRVLLHLDFVPVVSLFDLLGCVYDDLDRDY